VSQFNLDGLFGIPPSDHIGQVFGQPHGMDDFLAVDDAIQGKPGDLSDDLPLTGGEVRQ
jgi:hypothetical protein